MDLHTSDEALRQARAPGLKPAAPITVTKATLPVRAQFDAYLDAIFSSRRLTNNGPLALELERRLESHLGVKHVVLVANGTLALQIAYRLLGLQGNVITTPFSFVATVNSLLWEGLTPVFSDVQLDTFNLDPTALEQAITPATSGIVPVHVFGNACDVDSIRGIASRHGLRVVYDASHAFGIQGGGGMSLLAHGDVSTLSFHATKIFHTVEGGALIVQDDELYERAKRMINFGFGSDGHPSQLGINGKLSEIHAAMGLCLLDSVETGIERRKHLFELYRELLADSVRFQVRNPAFGQNYAYCPVVFESESQAVQVWQKLRESNIDSRRYFYPSLNTLNYLKEKPTMLCSEWVAARILCLPLYESLTGEDIGLIAGLVRKWA